MLKKTRFDKFVSKVNSIDTCEFVLKIKYDTDRSDLENKILDTCELVKKTDYNTKITEIENKIPSISALFTNSTLTAVEDKIPNISILVKKKTDYNTKISEFQKKLTDHDHEEYLTTTEVNDLAARVFTARLKQANLVTKTDFDDKPKCLNQKITSNKTKNLIVAKMNLKN